MTAAEIADAMGGRPTGDGWMIPCPAHDDRTPSCSLTERDGRLLVRCHAGCSQAAVIAALRQLGLWPAARTARAHANDAATRPPDHVWPYPDATGAAVRRTARWDHETGGKTIRPQTPNGRGGWRIGEMKGPRPLYRLTEVLAQSDAVVLVVEGEKAADAAAAMLTDYVVTTSAGGSKAALRTDWFPVRKRRVVIWPDADLPGEHYAADVARLAAAAGAVDVRLVTPPAGLPEGWDLADPLPDGWTADAVRQLIEAARPEADVEAARRPGRRAHLICVADVAPETIEWLWWPRLARGKLTLLAGDPGTGKTFLTLAVAAALSRGWVLPGETTTREACSVVYLSREDGVGDTLRPRLDALDADVRRVHVLAGADDGGSVSLADVEVIASAIEQTGAALIVVDPIQSWLGAGVDAHRANETRPVLDALGAVCAKYRCACLLIAHTAKARGGRAVTAALGSIDFAGAARVMLIAGADPHDTTRNVLAGAKTNIGPMPGSIAYAIDRETGGFTWAGPVDLTAADVLAADSATEDERSELSDAVAWLRGELAAGPRPSTEMKREAKAAGIKNSVLNRARHVANVRARRRGFGPGGEWVWCIGVIEAQAPDKSPYGAYDDDDAETGVI